MAGQMPSCERGGPLTVSDGEHGVKWLVLGKSAYGICVATRALAFITKQPLIPVLNKGISVRAGRCSQGDSCLNHRCQLNHTTFRSARRGVLANLARSERQYKKLLVRWNGIQELFEGEDRDTLEKILASDGIIEGVVKEEDDDGSHL